MSVMIFPMAFMANTFAIMLLMIGLALFGKPALAADFGLIHGATVALFYSFSGNARSLILGASSEIYAADILRVRLFMVLPLGALAFMLCIGVVDGGWLFVLLLIVRRAAEWLAEIFLSQKEVDRHGTGALRFLLLQGGCSGVLLLVLLGGEGALSAPVMLIWAASPLLGCLDWSLLHHSLGRGRPVLKSIRALLPHFGSTLVIGVSVYVFRLFILLVAGKEVAGDLFSAFALGGILGAVFSQALGPTMVRQEYGAGRPGRLRRLFDLLMLGTLLAGLLLVGLVWKVPELFEWTGKAQLFWLAVGCSLIGGVVMVLAQRIRLRILQGGSGKDVFGSDILANLLLIAAVPLFYYGAGTSFLAVLYLFGAVLSLMFYSSESKGLFFRGSGMFGVERQRVLEGIMFLLFAPVFMQISNGLYVEQSSYFNSGGSLRLLPIPISVVACYTAIVIFGGYVRARYALLIVFLSFVGMLISSILLVSSQQGYEVAKLILLIQYVLPMFALVLGQQFGSSEYGVNVIAKLLLWVLLIAVPLQLIATLSKGMSYLSPSLFVFSIYQHLQYVPVLFAGFFLVALFALWEQAQMRRWLLLLSALMGIYAALSVSILTMALLLVGVLCFALRSLVFKVAGGRAVLAACMVVGGVVGGIFYIANASILGDKFGVVSELGVVSDLSVAEGGPVNLQERMVYWRYYLEGITESSRSLLLGHAYAPDRNSYPSAHNYYIDFVYNFGLLALLPLLGLLGWTIYRVLRDFSFLWRKPALLGLAGVVAFLLLADNGLKVGMRQPYPGIITFFFWGLLLASLSGLSKREDLPSADAHK